jgi:hypothetical protein
VAGVLATTGGCLSTLTASAAGERSLGVVLDGAPNGLRKYALRLAAPATVAAVTPKLVFGPQFQTTAGGPGERTVAFRAVDFAGTVGPFEGERTLAVVEYEDPVRVASTTLSVRVLEDDDGAEMDHGRVRVTAGD